MKSTFLLLLMSLTTFLMGQTTPIIIGEKVELVNSVNGETYHLNIHKTHGYHLTDDPFPVLYVLDGEAHFQHVSAMVDYYAAAYGGRQIPPIIVVGIENNKRNRDFTPTNRPKWADGKADDFLTFLEKDAIPFVEKNYRVAPFRILAGHSLTAQFNLYSIAKKPGLFQAHIAISPWLVYDEEWLLTEWKTVFAGQKMQPEFLFSTIGGEEEELVLPFEKMQQLTDNQMLAKEQLFKVIPETTHETVYLPSMTKGLFTLFKDWKISIETLKAGLESIEAHYATISKQLGYQVDTPEYVLNEVGYYFLGKKELEKALEIFQRNQELNPESPNVYDSLGDVYDHKGDAKKALENYEKAVLLARPMNHPSLKWFEANYERLKKE